MPCPSTLSGAFDPPSLLVVAGIGRADAEIGFVWPMNGRPGEGLECHFRHTLSGRMDGGFWLHNFPMFIIFLRAKRRHFL